jgi:membrane-bound lytic murein transglycosylase D
MTGVRRSLHDPAGKKPANRYDSHVRLCVTLILVLCAAGTDAAPSQPPAPMDAASTQTFHEAILETGNRILSIFTDDVELDPEIVRQIPPPEEWPAFWNRVQQALKADSPEQLAWLRPEAESAITILDRFPAGTPYATWLRQRLDYVNMADEVLRESPDTRPQLRFTPAVPSNALPRRVSVVPPPLPQRPANANDTVVAVATVGKRIGDTMLWKRRLNNRPAPTGAPLLIPRAKAAFRQEGVPEELAWIAEVESSVDPSACSPVGAVGMYQFMPATAKRFGLKTSPVDDRKDPEKSARAAAQYLKYLYAKFASWPLALAAYNAGEGTVARAMEKNKAETFDAIAHSLPVETRMYVPKVGAVISLREGHNLENLPAPK